MLGQLEDDRSFFGITLNLHRALLAGTTGRVIVELATSWGLILIVTGIYLWWPRDGKNVSLRQNGVGHDKTCADAILPK